MEVLELPKTNTMKIKKALFQVNLGEVMKLGLDLNHIYILEKLEQGAGISTEPKVAAWVQGLVRKGFLTLDFKPTEAGYLILDKLRDGEESVAQAVKKLETVELTDFEKWWKEYPPTDAFTHKGKEFKLSRSLKAKKDECKVKFYKIIKGGKYTAEELIAALKLEVESRKDTSIRDRENKLKYMHNSLTYLNQEDYASFVEQAKQNKNQSKQPNSEASGGTFSI